MISDKEWSALKERASKLKKLPNFNDHINQSSLDIINELMDYQDELEKQIELLNNNKIELNYYKEIKQIYDSSPISFFLINANGIIIDTNEAAALLLGMVKSDILNKSFSRYVAPDFQSEFSRFKEGALNQSTITEHEIKISRRNNCAIYVKLTGKAIFNPHTQDNNLFIAIAEVANFKRFDLSTRNALSSDSIGQMYSMIIGGINQPLTVIANYIHGCIHRIKSGNYQTSHILNAMEYSTEQLHKIAQIILRMKNLGGKEILQFEKYPVDQLILETVTLLKQEFNDFPLAIQYRFNKEIPKILLDKIYIQQVLLNLARNAVEAMKDNNTPNPKLIIEVNRLDLKMMEICVIDNGPGVSIKNSHQLFDPHFTTKSYGVGIGLALCKSIVESHGGELAVDTNATQGACFKVFLPMGS